MDGPKSLVEHFSSIKDPRIDRTKKHKLSDIIVLAICAVICGADDWESIAMICEEKADWFEKFLELPNGIPSPDTFARVFSRISPQEFEKCFVSWTQTIAKIVRGEIISIDGKRVCGSYDSASEKAAIHMVSAWAHDNKLVLGQIKVDDKSNEITAIPKLLEMLDIAGCIVTIDAMGCQKEIAEKIISKKGDYLFGLKGNQGHTHEAVRQFFDTNTVKAKEQLHTTIDGDHGRIEQREYTVAKAEVILDLPVWPGINSVAKVRSQVEYRDGRVTVEERFYITSLPPTAKTIAKAIRGHWGIENTLHWTLDVQFGEDDSRIRKDHAPENFSRLRRLTVNMLKAEKSLKRGIQKKRMMCLMKEDYLMKVLRGAD